MTELLEKNSIADFLNVKELSKKICLPEFTIRKLAREKKIPAYQITRNYLFDYDEVIIAIKNNKAK